MIIDLIRHTRPNVEPGTCYGQADIDCADSFANELQSIKKKAMPIYDKVVSSPLKRCKKLAQALSSETVVIEPRIMEYNFGDWELRPWSDITGEDADKWMSDFVEQAAPNGESLLQMQTRVMAFWHELLKQNHRHTAVICHAGVQRIIHADILMNPIEHIFRLQLGYGHIIRIQHNKHHNTSTLKHL